MKRKMTGKWMTAIFLLLASPQAMAKAPQRGHFDPEMTGPEYRAIWTELAHERAANLGAIDDPLKAILQLGGRNLAWVDAINSTRSDDDKLQLSTPETTEATPISTHRESSRPIILQLRDDTLSKLPAAIAEILLSDEPLPPSPPEDDAVFLAHARAVDKLYQAASRWLLQEPELEYYAENSQRDIRGYYFLTREPDLTEKLQNWTKLELTQQQRLAPWLGSLCRNSGESWRQCSDTFDRAQTGDNLVEAYFQNYWPHATEVWNSFFLIENARPDADFSNPLSFTLPFLDPVDNLIRHWLRSNIEDEWRLGDFQLRLAFQEHGSPEHTAHVVFEPGATPHVDSLGGSRITMDANRNIQDYLERWTIRHEFGHVLGFPDCYIEFFDVERGVMIYYQIDANNLMCSRRGHLQEHHLEELRRAYRQ